MKSLGCLAGLVLLVACSDSPGPSSIAVTAVSLATGALAGDTSVTITRTNFVNVTIIAPSRPSGTSHMGDR